MMVLGLKLLIAHILGDFVFQPSSWVEAKKRKKHKSVYFYLHGLVHFISLLVLLEFDWSFWLPILIIVLSHLVIDLIKLNLEGIFNPRLLFSLDQLLHIVVIAGVVYSYYPFSIEWGILYSSEVLFLLLALLLLTFVSSVLMKTIMSKWEFEENDPKDSLQNAGKYIGILERVFVFVFIILKFGIILQFVTLFGTLLSFGLAIGIALLYQFLKFKIHA